MFLKGAFSAMGTPLGAPLGVVYPDATERDIQACREAGGYAIIGYTGYLADRSPDPRTAYVKGCQFPAVGARADNSINIAVPTAVTTQVSPQVSPTLVQQDQPSGSGVTAGTTQTAPYNASATQTGRTQTADEGISEMLKYLRDHPQDDGGGQSSAYGPAPMDYANASTTAAPGGLNTPMLLAGVALLGLILLAR